MESLAGDVVAIAHRAGSMILDVYSKDDFGATYKEEGSPVTLADEAAHRVISEGLKNLSPRVPVLSEESRQEPFDARRTWERFWLVDTLDGTKEFIERNGEFTVNVALVEGSSAVFGVVHSPVLGITYWGGKGIGAFRLKDGIPSRITVSDYTKEATLKMVASRSHRGEELERFLNKLEGAELLNMGSSLKFCLVAEGSAHLYPRFGPTMEWDTGAAQAVVEAAVGSVVDLSGRPLSYNKEDLKNPYFIVAGKPPFPWHKYINQ